MSILNYCFVILASLRGVPPFHVLQRQSYIVGESALIHPLVPLPNIRIRLMQAISNIIIIFPPFQFSNKYKVVIIITMDDIRATPASANDPQSVILPYATFWNKHGSSYPFSSIYRTRHVMRIRWAIVADSAVIFTNQPSPIDFAILPYNSPLRSFINSKIYSCKGFPVPSELQDIVEFFVYFAEVPPECTRLFLAALWRTIRSHYYTIPEKILHVKRYALYYIIPPLLLNFCSYEDLYESRQDTRLARWWAYLLSNPLPSTSCFKDLVSPSITNAIPIFGNESES